MLHLTKPFILVHVKNMENILENTADASVFFGQFSLEEDEGCYLDLRVDSQCYLYLHNMIIAFNL